MENDPLVRLKARCLIATGAAALGLLVLMYAPPFDVWTSPHISMLTVHLLLELFAVTIAALIVVVSWHAFGSPHEVRQANLMLAGFLVVAVCDLVHALTYEGMPLFLEHSSTPRAIFFWLMGRTAEVTTFALIALGVGLAAPRWAALGTGAAVAGVLVAVGSYRLDLFPVTFVPGQGVTPFKAGYEYMLMAGNLAVGGAMWHRAGRTGQGRYHLLALSCFLMGMGELAFTRYRTPSDFQNIFGHVYKVASYALLYLATFHASIRTPYEGLQASEQRARESELRLRSLSNNLPNCVVYQVVREADGRMCFTHVSDSVEQQNGLRAQDVLRDSSLLYRQLHPDDLREVTAVEAHSARELRVFDLTVRLRRADGQWRRMHLYSAPRRLDDGRVLWDGVAFDVTEQREADDARRALELRLRETQKMEAIGTLAGGIAHDFNNVLGSLLGNLSMAREDLHKGATARADAAVAQAEKAGRRARELVRQILTFSRRQPQELQRQPLQPLVEESVSLLRSTLPAGVNLDLTIAPVTLHVLADGTQVEQVVMNLCTNAWQAMGGRHGHIAVNLEQVHLDAQTAGSLCGLPAGDYVHLAVTDDGVGIEPSALDHIFEPFYTTKPAGEGTGLGLAVVHGIVRAHHGAITVDSKPDVGSTFHVYFPGVLPASGGGSKPDEPAAAAASGAGQHVLYVDDDELMELMVVRLLEREGYRVSSYRNPAGALAALRAQPQVYDALVTDYNMPEMSGLDLAAQVQRIRPGLPVLLSSGYVSETLQAEAAQRGVIAIVHKQNTLEELSGQLRAALDKCSSAA
ncbi:MASE3 domain-containing protein [Sphaerotilaceae bacterium SBD11-9]